MGGGGGGEIPCSCIQCSFRGNDCSVFCAQKEKLVITCSLCDLHFDKRKKLQKHMWTCHEILVGIQATSFPLNE